MERVYYIGKYLPAWRKRPVDIFVKAEFNNGRLSISGVIGPLPSGNASGGCGQIDMDFSHRNPEDNDKRYDNPISPEEITFAKGWNKDLWWDFLDVWKQWHLNDMKPGCKHQRELGWGKKEIEIVEYRLLYPDKWGAVTMGRISDLCKSITTGSFRTTVMGIPSNNLDARKVVARTYYEVFCTHFQDTDSFGFESVYNYPKKMPAVTGKMKDFADLFCEKKSETKLSGWVYEHEHPEGVLMKACPTCGYKYGSAWLKEEVPQDIINWLATLPEPTKWPVWI